MSDDSEFNSVEPSVCPVAVEMDDAAELPVIADDRESNQWLWQHPGIGWSILWTLLLFGAQGGLGIAIGVIGGPGLAAGMEDLPLLILGSATTTLTAIMVVGLMFGRWTPERMGLRPFSWTHGVIVLGLIVPFAVVSSEIANVALEFLPHWGLDWLGEMHQESWPTLFIGGCILPAVGEELYFRGFLSRGLIARRGWWIGSFVASALFALIHIVPIQVCAVFWMGFVLQYVYIATRSLPAAMLLHFGNNFLAFATTKLGDEFHVPGLNSETAEVIQHTPWSVLLFAVLSAATLLLALYQSRVRWFLPNGSEWRSETTSLDAPAAHWETRSVSQRPHLFVIAAALSCYIGLWAVIIQSAN